MSARRLAQWLIVFACLASALAVLAATSRGVGLSPDSLQYIAASESANAGRGLTTFGWDGEATPLTHFPPAYPLVLAVSRVLGWSPEVFARWSNLALFVLTITLAAIIARRLAPRSTWAAPTVAVACAGAHDLVVVHSMAWSEPLYLALTLGGLFVLGRALDRGSVRLLFVAALVAGGAAVTRYVGVANVAVVGLAVLWWWSGSWWRRIGTAAGFSLVGALPLVLLFALNARSGGIGNRQLAWHPLTAVDLRMAAGVVSKWVTPANDAGVVTAVWILVLATLLGVVLAGRSAAPPSDDGREGRTRLPHVLLVFGAAYVAVLALAMSLLDAQTVFEPRHLTPLFIPLLIVGVTWLARQSAHNRAIRLATGGLVATFLGANMMRMLPWLREANAHGLALRRVEDDAIAVLNAARQLPGQAQLYSNDPYFVRVHTARIVPGLPRERDPNSLRFNPRFQQQVRAICASAALRPTFLVLFDVPMSPDSSATADIAERGGHAQLLPGGVLVRVRPHCGAGEGDPMHLGHRETAPAAARLPERAPNQ